MRAKIKPFLSPRVLVLSKTFAQHIDVQYDIKDDNIWYARLHVFVGTLLRILDPAGEYDLNGLSSFSHWGAYRLLNVHRTYSPSALIT